MIPIWMPIAFDELKRFVTEIRGVDYDVSVVKYLESVMDLDVKSDEVPWCAAFVNWVLKEAGVRGTGRANARSFSTWGDQSHLAMGAVVVLWRGEASGIYGHVGFHIAHDLDTVWLLGGNQQDSLNISQYPRNRIIATRLPK